MQSEVTVVPTTNVNVEAFLLTHYPSLIQEDAINLPLCNEAHIPIWTQYTREAGIAGYIWPVLRERLLTLRFPIQAGMSQNEFYRLATRQGVCLYEEKAGLALTEPKKLILIIYQSIAGQIPVICTSHRQDFVKLVQALTKKNEPIPIPDSMGACMVAGYNNWDRIHTYRKQWTAENPNNCSEEAWQAEFKRLIPQKHLYQDRFIIVHDGPYSGIPAVNMNLEENEWRQLSLKIRLEHECTHYFTKRLFGIMRRHVFDELLADYAGIVAALGHYRADWFLQFMGLEAYPNYRLGGRLQNYLDTPPGSELFTAVQSTLKRASANLEIFDAQARKTEWGLRQHALTLMAITRLNLAQLAGSEAPHLLFEALHEVEQKFEGA